MRSKPPAQLITSPRKARTHQIDRNRKRDRRFGVRHLFHQHEYGDRAEVRRKARQGRSKRPPDILPFGLHMRMTGERGISDSAPGRGVKLRPRGFTSHPPEMIEREIDGDPKQPWPEGRWLLGRIKTREGSETGVLHDLLGNRSLSDQSKGGTEQRAKLRTRQLLEPLSLVRLAQHCLRGL